MTNIDLPSLRALADAASKAPWSNSYDGVSSQFMVCVDTTEDNTIVADSCEYDNGHANAAFIAAARSAVPMLLDRVEQLEVALAEAINLALNGGSYCHPQSVPCHSIDCQRLAALAAMVAK